MPPERTADAGAASGGAHPPGLALAGLHLLVLWSLVAVQPMFDVLGDAPEFFVARENTTGDILLLAFGLMFGPPLLLTGAEAAAGLISLRLRWVLHLTLVGLLVAALALQALGGTGMGALAIFALGAAFGVAAAVAYARASPVRSVVTALAPAPLVVLVVFLIVSPVSSLLFGGDDAASADVNVADDTPVIVVVFDELSGLTLLRRDGHIDGSRLPAFGRLARDATWYRNATSVADYTDRAVPAIVTGERPRKGRLPTAADNPESLFTLLGGDYDFTVTEPITAVCPERLCPVDRPGAGERLRDLVSDLSVVAEHLLLPDDLRDELPPIDRGFAGFRNAFDVGQAALDERDLQVEAFLRRLGRRSERPAFAFLHTLYPHAPYDRLPDGRRYPGSLPFLGVDRPQGDARALALHGMQRYLLQVGYADLLLGRVLDRLRRSGLYDRALVVVTADHGSSFAAGLPHRSVETGNLHAVAGVPLLVKAPGQRRGRIDDANVSSIDVLPTIAALLGTRLPWRVEGLLAGRRSPREPVAVQARYGDSGTRTMPFAQFVRRRDAAVRRLSADFRLGRRWPERRLRVDADLVGRRLSELGARPASQSRFELERADALRTVDPRGPVVPVQIDGRLSDEDQAGQRLGIAVNGRIATVVRPFRQRGAHRFSAVVSPERFRRGANRVDVVRIAGAGGGRRFALLRGGDLDPRLVRAAGAEAIVDERGRRIPIGPGIEGRVDKTAGPAPLVQLSGWAGDLERRRAAELVLAFAGRRFVGATRPSGERADLTRLYGQGLARAGFTVAGDTGARPGAPARRLRVFAVLDGRASPLEGVEQP